MPVTIYLDTCALNRLSDDQTQPRIRSEAAAVEHILDLISAAEIRWIASTVVRTELEGNPNQPKREVSLALLAFASGLVAPQEATRYRAGALEAKGFGAFDALHLASAEAAKADCLLTVDDRFISLATRLQADVSLPVLNPVDWLERRSSWLLQPKWTR